MSRASGILTGEAHRRFVRIILALDAWALGKDRLERRRYGHESLVGRADHYFAGTRVNSLAAVRTERQLIPQTASVRAFLAASVGIAGAGTGTGRRGEVTPRRGWNERIRRPSRSFNMILPGSARREAASCKALSGNAQVHRRAP